MNLPLDGIEINSRVITANVNSNNHRRITGLQRKLTLKRTSVRRRTNLLTTNSSVNINVLLTLDANSRRFGIATFRKLRVLHNSLFLRHRRSIRAVLSRVIQCLFRFNNQHTKTQQMSRDRYKERPHLARSVRNLLRVLFNLSKRTSSSIDKGLHVQRNLARLLRGHRRLKYTMKATRNPRGLIKT